MPRLTRKALAEDTPPRSSPRASTRASTVAAASPSPTKTPRGRRGKIEEEPEPKADVETKKRGRSTSRGKAAVTPPAAAASRQSRSRGRSTGAEAKKTSTPARRGRGKAKKEEPEEEEEEEEMEEEEEDKEEEEEEVTPRRGRGRPQSKSKSPAAAKKSTPPAKGSRGSRRSAVTAAEEKEESPKTTARGQGKRSASAATPPARSRRGRGAGEPQEDKEEEKEEDTKVDESGETTKDTVDKKEETLAVEPEEETSAPAEAKKEELVTDSEAKGEADVETEKEKVTKTDSLAEKETVKEPAPAEEEPMEEEAPAVTAEPQNSAADDTQPPPKAGVKRKLEEDSVEEEAEAKRVRLNGTETDSGAADAEMKDSEPAVAEKEPSDSDILKDYVVVNKEELPAPDSSEVAAAVPAPKPEKVKTSEDETMKAEVTTEKDVSALVVDPVMVVPLTEAEVAKAYASEVQGKERVEQDDVSSTIVEVGSVAGSDVTGGLSRGLDISEVQSASNSVDGDHAADSSINESMVVPPTFLSPAPQDRVCDKSDNNPAATPPPAAQVTQTNTNGDSSEVSQGSAATEQPEPSSAPVSMETDTAAVQNCEQNRPVGKGSGSVTDSLGKPDPAFLAAHSSTSILKRAYVPNPAVPADSVTPADRFTVVSYNILAECHRLKDDYSYSAEEVLCQSYRHDLLMKELQYLDGDIICLQEVSPDYFDNTLLPALKSLGYDGLLKCRTKVGYEEGEATFYKTSVFELLSSKGVSLTEVAHKEVETGGLSTEVGAAINKYLDRADVVLITRLKCKASDKVVTVGNIHVVWDFLKSPDVQCIQAACGIKEVVGMAGSDGAHMICGDFNSEWSSPAYQLMLDGYLSDSSIHTLQAVQRLELNDGAKSLVNHLWRAFQHTSSNLKSAYSTVTKSEPEITTFTANMMNAVDYVFYSAGSLVPVGVLKTIDYTVVDETGGLPNKDYPSDHLAMKAVMAFSK